jgi:HicA toxin of bacterial toxin-antitoxin,
MAYLLDQKSAIQLAREKGWRVSRQAQHGVKMIKRGRRPLILPRHHGQPYGKGLTAAVARQAGLNPKEVKAWISRSRSNQTGRDIGRGL